MKITNNKDQCAVFNPADYSWLKRLWWKVAGHRSLEGLIYHGLSEHWGGNDMVPLDHRTLYITEKNGCDYVFSFLNDSFDIGIGYPNQWHVILRRETIHSFIFWYLRQWVFGGWLGIRRWIWYKMLRRRVVGYRRVGKL